MKSNKELAVELTIAYIQSWFGNNSTAPIYKEECVEILNLFKESLDAMTDTKEA